MPIEQATNTNVSCDNPDCPNKKNLPEGLSNDNLTGWLIVSVEEYAVSSVMNGVFCSWDCVTAVEKPAERTEIPVPQV